jgi:hypothetical protein
VGLGAHRPRPRLFEDVSFGYPGSPLLFEHVSFDDPGAESSPPLVG